MRKHKYLSIKGINSRLEGFVRKHPIVFSLIVVTVLLVILDCIFKCTILNRMSENNGRISSLTATYWGAIVGGFISGGITLFGVLMTIRFTQDENRKAKELEYRPWLDYTYKTVKAIMEGKIIQDVAFESFDENGTNPEPKYYGVLSFINVGVGPAIDINVQYEYPDDGRKHQPILHGLPANNNTCQSGETAVIPFVLYLHFDSIPKESFQYNDKGEAYLPHDFISKYKDYDFSITIQYKDLLNNQYEQVLSFKASIGCEYKIDGSENGSYHYGMRLNEVGLPKQV